MADGHVESAYDNTILIHKHGSDIGIVQAGPTYLFHAINIDFMHIVVGGGRYNTIRSEERFTTHHIACNHHGIACMDAVRECHSADCLGG